MAFRLSKRSQRPGGVALVDANPEVARAEALVTEGRPVDAIAVLTAENRRHPDPEIERRLVGLRHDAFGRDEAAAGPAAL